MDFKNNDQNKWNRFLLSFKYAWEGLVYTIKHEKNMKIHILIAIVVIGSSFILNISTIEKVTVLIVIANVIAFEIINTAIERIVDLVSPQYHPLAKLAKDAAAGAVLLFSIFAVVVGMMIFWGPFIQFMTDLFK